MQTKRVSTGAMSICAALVLTAAAASFAAEKVTLTAHEDFPNYKLDGFAPYRKHKSSGYKVLGVNADDPKKVKGATGYAFGAALHVFKGDDHYYDLELHTVTDADGRCKYFVMVGEYISDTLEQKIKGKNGAIEKLTFKKVPLRKGDSLIISSNGSDSEKHKASNAKGPAGYHMAHGRWTKVVLTPVAPLEATSIRTGMHNDISWKKSAGSHYRVIIGKGLSASSNNINVQGRAITRMRMSSFLLGVQK